MTRTLSLGIAAALILAGSAPATEEMGTLASDAVEGHGVDETEPSVVDEPEPAEFEEPMANGHVARAIFTTGVAEREPMDDVKRLSNETTEILFFTELRDLQGQDVTHTWEREGNVMAKVPFTVGAPRWRVYSSKTLDPSLTGEWSVKVVDAAGQVIHAEFFEYVTAASSETAAPPASMPPMD
jgi:hypothetical protein